MDSTTRTHRNCQKDYNCKKIIRKKNLHLISRNAIRIFAIVIDVNKDSRQTVPEKYKSCTNIFLSVQLSLALSTVFGSYQFTQLHEGLTFAPSTFVLETNVTRFKSKKEEFKKRNLHLISKILFQNFTHNSSYPALLPGLTAVGSGNISNSSTIVLGCSALMLLLIVQVLAQVCARACFGSLTSQSSRSRRRRR